MTEIFLTEKISNKIKQLRKADNPEDQVLFKKIYLVVKQIELGVFRKAKKVLNTENIFVIKVNNDCRLFYTIEKNKDNQEFILLLDFVNKTNYKSDYYPDIIKEFNDYKDKR
ncbi:hypothetical protein [Peribacillus butanolivorans]|uniref:hypothetical protein n=1 Tax=Peribacillus butanolivorans TaxID=421767 RepID=UPI00381A962B